MTIVLTRRRFLLDQINAKEEDFITFMLAFSDDGARGCMRCTRFRFDLVTTPLRPKLLKRQWPSYDFVNIYGLCAMPFFEGSREACNLNGLVFVSCENLSLKSVPPSVWLKALLRGAPLCHDCYVTAHLPE